MTKRRTDVRLPLLGLFVTMGLLLALGLAACGDSTTVSSGGTVGAGIVTAGTGAGQSAGTAASGAVTAAGTAVAGARTIAATAASGAGQVAGTVGTGAGTAASNAGRTAGTAVAGAMTPGAMPGATPAGTMAGSMTTAAGASTTPGAGMGMTSAGLPMYTGAQAVTVSQTQQVQLVPGLSTLATFMDQPSFNAYRLPASAMSGSATSTTAASTTPGSKMMGGPVGDFYRTQLTSMGWMDRTSQLSQISQLGTVSFFGNSPMLFQKGDQLLFVGVSSPLTADAISTAGVTSVFQPGDVAIMTFSGTPKIKIQL